MQDEIKNLIKNALEENIVQFKEQAGGVLYSKVAGRLKKEYVNISKNMFKSLNEIAAPAPTLFNQPEPMEPQQAPPPPPGTNNNPVWPAIPPLQETKPPKPEDYFPPGYGPNNPPQREHFPDDKSFQQALEAWERAVRAYNRHKAAYERWYRRAVDQWEAYDRALEAWNRRAPPKGPRPTPPTVPDPRKSVGGTSGSPARQGSSGSGSGSGSGGSGSGSGGSGSGSGGGGGGGGDRRKRVSAAYSAD